MSRRRKKRNGFPGPPQRQPNTPTVYHFDRFSLEDVRRWKQGQDEFKRIYWAQYDALAFQRSEVMDEINRSLNKAAIGPFNFTGYQRAVKYKWSQDPLSIQGSIREQGGRFNIGQIDTTRFPPFPALYLGQDRDTVLQEILQSDLNPSGGLTPQELALTDSTSVSIVAVYGSLETIIDLYQPERLQGFVDVIKGFKVSGTIKTDAKKVGLTLSEVENITQLLSAIYEPNWRGYPLHLDLPSGSQTFGQLAYKAGIEGICFKSKYSEKPCLAIFPQNFRNPDSFVQLVDEAPKGVIRNRLDSKTYDRVHF